MSGAWFEESAAMAILDALAAHAAILDHNGIVVATNGAWVAFAKEHPTDPWRPEVGRSYLEACERAARSGSAEAMAVADAVRSVLSGGQTRFHVDYPASVDEDLWFSLRISALAVEGGGAVVTHNDITTRKVAEKKLAHQALHDPLTQLPNRTLFLDRLSLGLARMERSQSSLAVLFIDLDKFKEVNDGLGHDVGDHLLVAVGDRLRSAIRPGDTAARYGGDEFTVLCEGITSESDAVVIAERIGSAVSRPFALGDAQTVLTSSIGIAIASEGERSPENLIHQADSAMYRAKKRGRARYEMFSGVIRARSIERLELGNALHRALDLEDFRLHVQPEIDMATGEVAGLEALLRWDHPENADLELTDWLPLADELGVIAPIGGWVLRELCRVWASWPAESRFRQVQVAMNVSQRELVQPGFVDTVLQAVEAVGLPPALLAFEVRQQTLAGGGEIVAATLAQLRREGFKTTIDDFGTAFALLQHEADTVKVDLATLDDPGGRLLGPLVDLGHALGVRVVGKRVESPDQLERLRSAGCDAAQGYLLGRPRSVEDLELPD